MFRAQKADIQNRYKGLAIGRAAHAVAQLDFEVRSGRELGQPGGDRKVPGIGKGTANYIDEFLEAGELYEIEEYDRMAHEANMEEEEAAEKKKKDDSGEKEDGTEKANSTKAPSHDSTEGSTSPTDDKIFINRAPVLTLWVTVVAQRQGFSRPEALSFGKFVSAMFARSKGRALGLFKEKHDTEEERKERKQMDQDLGVQHVQGFGRMKIPTLMKDGNRLAVIQGQTQDPAYVEDYLHRSFGDEQLHAAQEAMQELAASWSLEEIQTQAYKLYEQFRPSWKGWGKPSILDLSKVRKLSKKD